MQAYQSYPAKNILVVDQDKATGEFLNKVLGEECCSMQIVTSATEALTSLCAATTREIFQHGADDCITKPFEANFIKRLINEALERC